jgi:hypothetical protein
VRIPCRTRPRHDDQREGGAESAVAPPAATETIEIVASADNPAGAARSETIAIDTWAADSGFEAASLAPFAGDAAPPPPPATAAESGEPRETPGPETGETAPVPLAEAEQGVPFVSGPEREFEQTAGDRYAAAPWSEPREAEAAAEPGHVVAAQPEAAESPPIAVEPAHAAPLPEPIAPAEPDDQDISSIWQPPAEAGPAESVYAEPPGAEPLEPAYAEPSDAEAAAAEPTISGGSPPARPGEEVLTITEKPANPRRGWWQRVTRP